MTFWILIISIILIMLAYAAGKDKGYWEAHLEIRHTLKVDGREGLLSKDGED